MSKQWFINIPEMTVSVIHSVKQLYVNYIIVEVLLYIVQD